jgi:hypothetical protein
VYILPEDGHQSGPKLVVVVHNKIEHEKHLLRTVVLIKILVDTRATGCITQQLSGLDSFDQIGTREGTSRESKEPSNPIGSSRLGDEMGSPSVGGIEYLHRCSPVGQGREHGAWGLNRPTLLLCGICRGT